MSVAAVRWVLKHSKATRSTRAVLLVLADYAGADGKGAFPSLRTIAEEAGVSERTARYSLRKLESTGVIHKTGIHERCRTSIYDLAMGATVAGGQILPGGNVSLPPMVPLFSPPTPPSLNPPLAPHPSAPTSEFSKSENSDPTPPRPKDVLWDALVEEIGEPRTRSERGRRNKALKELREVGATVEEIHERCEAYRRAWPNVSLTATALTAHWSEVLAAPNGRGLSAADILAIGEEK